MRGIVLLDDRARRDRLPEARPSGPRVELLGGAEQRLAGHDVDVDAGGVIVEVLVVERRFGALVLRDFVLHRRQLFAQLRV